MGQTELFNPLQRIIIVTIISYLKTDYSYYIRGVSSWYNSKRVGLWNRSKRVRTPVAQLRSLSDKNAWERYETPNPSSAGLNSITAVLLEGRILALNNPRSLIYH